jgi:hypothetical protein
MPCSCLDLQQTSGIDFFVGGGRQLLLEPSHHLSNGHVLLNNGKRLSPFACDLAGCASPTCQAEQFSSALTLDECADLFVIVLQREDDGADGLQEIFGAAELDVQRIRGKGYVGR